MPTKSKTIKVLIVEDDPILSDMYNMRFREESYEIFNARNGQEALEVAQKEKPDVILLDVIMPLMDGFSALKELKSNASTKNIKVVMLTNLGQKEDIEKGKELGAADYFIKANFTPTQLVEKVQGILAK